MWKPSCTQYWLQSLKYVRPVVAVQVYPLSLCFELLCARATIPVARDSGASEALLCTSAVLWYIPDT